MSTEPTANDEIRVTSAAHGESTIWWVSIYDHQKFRGRVGSATRKWAAVRIAWDLADRFSITEVNVRG